MTSREEHSKMRLSPEQMLDDAMSARVDSVEKHDELGCGNWS